MPTKRRIDGMAQTNDGGVGDDEPNGLWVFGYGSLMWNPGFPHVEARHARLTGHHRGLCIYSVVHRGTRHAPGLVFGLDRGGVVDGMAFRVAEAERSAVVHYLQEREQVTGVYREAHPKIQLRDDETGGYSAPVPALAFVVDATHTQYAGRLPLLTQLQIVRAACGGSGPNADYILNTARRLRDMCVRDRGLERLVGLLRQTERGLADQRAALDALGPWAHRMSRRPPGCAPKCVNGSPEMKANYRRRIDGL